MATYSEGITQSCSDDYQCDDQKVCTPRTATTTAATTTPSSAASPADATLLRQCSLQWRKQGSVCGCDDDRAVMLAYRFCAALSLANWPCCCMVMSCVRMLAECGYDFGDIEVTFAMAAAMMRSPRSAAFTEKMGTKEKLLVVLLHAYCAHSIVFDQFVHFNIWHDWLFAPFCSVKNSSAALRKVCTLRRWRFSVTLEVLEPVLAELQDRAVERESVDCL